MRDAIKNSIQTYDPSVDLMNSIDLLNQTTPEVIPKAKQNSIEMLIKSDNPATANVLPFSFNAVRKKIKEPELTEFINKMKVALKESKNANINKKLFNFQTESAPHYQLAQKKVIMIVGKHYKHHEFENKKKAKLFLIPNAASAVLYKKENF